MLVLNRKTLSIVLIIILLGVFAFFYKDTEKQTEPDQYVTTTPVSNKVIVLDARSPEYQRNGVTY